MSELPSSEFRKRYASLTEETTVTVSGHVIGYWFPAGTLIAPFASQPNTPERKAEIAARHPDRVRFNTQPFTGPIEKVRKR